MTTATTNVKDYSQLLYQLISLINEYQWGEAYDLSYELENLIENVLLYEFGEPNKVSDIFLRLRLYLGKNIRDDVKAKECRRIIAELLKVLSVYGLGTHVGETDGHYTLDIILEAYLNRLDNLMLEYSPSAHFQAPEFITMKKKIAEEIKRTLGLMKRVLMNYRTDRGEVSRLIENALTEIIDAENVLYDSLVDPKSGMTMFTKSLNGLKDTITKLIRMLRYPEYTDIVLETYEIQRGLKIPKGTLGVEEEAEEEKGKKKKKGKRRVETEVEEREVRARLATELISETFAQFDWVDEEWRLILQHPQIYLIIGHRGAGKSAYGWSVLEYLHKTFQIPAYLLNVLDRPIPAEKRKLLPKWINIIDEFDEAPNNCVVLVDEAYLKFHARTSMREARGRATMDKVLELSRQKRISAIFIVQRTDKLDKNIINAIDVLIIKNPSQWQIKFERAGLRKILEEAYEAFKKIPYKERVKYAFVVSDAFVGLKTCGLASFWSEELSHFYEGF